MRIFLKVIGYALLVFYGIDIIYIASGNALDGRSLDKVVWYLFRAIGIIALGIYLIRRPKLVKKIDSKSNTLGIWSLVFGIIGIFWWPAVLGIVGVILAILQLRRSTGKIVVAGLCLGIFNFISAGFWYDLGLMPSIF